MVSVTDLEARADKAAIDMERFSRIVNGGVDELVETDGAPVRTLRGTQEYGKPGPKGDPGGNVMSVGPFSSISSLNIPLGTGLIQTSGATRGILVEDGSLTDADVAAHKFAIVKTANGRYFRRDHRQDLWVEWFGAIGDGVPSADGKTVTGTDNVPAFAAANAYVQRYKAMTVRIGPGIFVLSSAPSGVAKAQISFPAGDSQADQWNYALIGSSPPSMTWGTNRGTILWSTYNDVAGGAVIGCRHAQRPGATTQPDYPHPSAAWTAVYIANLTVRLPQNPKMTGIDMSWVPYVKRSNVRVDVGGGVEVVPQEQSGAYTARFTMAEPTEPTSYAFKGPLNNLPWRDIYDDCLAFGFYTGYLMGELWGGRPYAIACKWVAELPRTYHAGESTYMLACNCQNGFNVTADKPTELHLFYAVEHDTKDDSGPAWITPLGTDVQDPDFNLRGEFIFHCHAAEFKDFPLTINGSKDTVHPNCHFQSLTGKAWISHYPAPMAFPNIFDPNKSHAIRTHRRGLVSDGTNFLPLDFLEVNQPNPGGVHGVCAAINVSDNMGADKRCAGWYSQGGTTHDDAAFVATVRRGGKNVTGGIFTSAGGIFLPVILPTDRSKVDVGGFYLGANEQICQRTT